MSTPTPPPPPQRSQTPFALVADLRRRTGATPVALCPPPPGSPARPALPPAGKGDAVQPRTTIAPAGWYPDPIDAGRLRFWRGSGWAVWVHLAPPGGLPTPQSLPPAPDAKDPNPALRVVWKLVSAASWCITALILLAMILSGGEGILALFILFFHLVLWSAFTLHKAMNPRRDDALSWVSAVMMGDAPAGWYRDPNHPLRWRWFDGTLFAPDDLEDQCSV